ncbi:acyl-CoA-binding domain-containing protein 6 [Drosophila mojavensis]|uniref:Acyl-CoA-binding domain-containing protein 6 n=1 Tax=Drosophila mojavensis TaxID=7230 RepID=B4L8N0_DROMO|nr:acyl-CoA-binding domain-containing protein 6 [Drosophila mojavensis]EDW08005.1 uncharacterized protein Dmoj_GI14444 [Drosophila mojavensis]
MYDSDLEIDDEEEHQQGKEHEKLFSVATEHVMHKANVYEARDLLEFYALYKQATSGACHGPRPSMLQMKARSKWQAWHELGDMSSADAQRAYVDKVHKLDPSWLDNKQIIGGTASGRTGWVVHSIESVPIEETNKPEQQKTLFDHVKEKNLERLREQLKPADLIELDEQGMALLHWATDRNAIEIIEFLIKQGADVDQRDAEQQTPLHYAASCGHVEALRYLLSLNANMELRDVDGQTCIDVADDVEICSILKAELQLRNKSSY